MELLECRCIWDMDEHNAFPDLIRFNNHWFCTVREGACHVGERDGIIRIIGSDDGNEWESVAEFALEGSDLRDAKLSVTPNGQLMLLAGQKSAALEYGVHVLVAFSDNGVQWSDLEAVTPADSKWLWRLTWFKSRGYGISYYWYNDKDWEIDLYETENGRNYRCVTKLDVPGWPNESTVRFNDDGTMMALVRRERQGALGWFGTSSPPYTDWKWMECNERISGQDFIRLSDGQLCVATRLYDQVDEQMVCRTSLCLLDPETAELTETVTFPSGRDCSYPGMVEFEGDLWVTYYSSHENKCAIYLAKVKI